MNENIEKPMIVAKQEFMDRLVEDINNCGLPLFVIEPILKDAYAEVRSMLQRQYELEKTQYENKIKAKKAQEAQSEE